MPRITPRGRFASSPRRRAAATTISRASLHRRSASAVGQQVIVDNRASRLVGGIVARSAPDGYTLVVGGGTMQFLPLTEKADYDVLTDFAPISQLERSPNVLVVNPSLKVSTVSELIALARAKPGSFAVRHRRKRCLAAPGRRDVHDRNQGEDLPGALQKHWPGAARPADQRSAHGIRHRGRSDVPHQGRQAEGAGSHQLRSRPR